MSSGLWEDTLLLIVQNETLIVNVSSHGSLTAYVLRVETFFYRCAKKENMNQEVPRKERSKLDTYW